MKKEMIGGKQIWKIVNRKRREKDKKRKKIKEKNMPNNFRGLEISFKAEKCMGK